MEEEMLRSKRSVALGVLVGFIAGAICSGYLTGKTVSASLSDHVALSAAADILLCQPVLVAMDRGEAEDVRKLLENSLDSSVVLLEFYADVPSSERDPNVVEAIRAAYEYRKNRPAPEGDPEVERSMARTFSIVAE